MENVVLSLTWLYSCIWKEGDSYNNLGQVWHLIQVDYQTKNVTSNTLRMQYGEGPRVMIT